ncbi:hypothetical protein ABEB36_002401 [Hypothenemus hampei]|uniref:Uncharacterized protein n=1 Tax=Hypothenemus hampei TaxID=57062 RepID=A0ABD1F5M7_HYPHA
MVPRNKMPDVFLKERYEKDIKYIKITDVYTPNYNQIPITPKFYSKYETGQFDEIDLEILKELKYAKDMLPSEKRDWPETTNQIYGWWSQPLVELNKMDSRFYFPKLESEITKHGLNMLLVKNPRNR